MILNFSNKGLILRVATKKVPLVLTPRHPVAHAHRAVLWARATMRGRDGSEAGEYLDEGEEQAEEAAHDVRRFYQKGKGMTKNALFFLEEAEIRLQKAGEEAEHRR